MIEPVHVDILVPQYAQWDAVYFFANPDGSPADLTGWTGTFQARTEVGVSPDVVNVPTSLYTYPGLSKPSGLRVTLSGAITGTLTLATRRYSYWLKAFDAGGVPGRGASGIMLIDPGPPP